METFIYVILILVGLSGLWWFLHRKVFFNSDVKESRVQASEKVFTRKLLKAFGDYMINNHNRFLRESREHHVSYIRLKIDEMEIRRKLPEFDLQSIIKTGKHLSIFNTLDELIRDNYLTLVSGTESSIDYESDKNYDFIVVTIKIFWR